MGDAGDLGVLLRDAFRGINDEYRHVTALHSGDGTDDTVPLQFFFHLALSAQSGRIDKYVLLSISRHCGINGVPGRSRDRGDDDSLLTQQTVDNGRLARVRLTDDRNLRALILFFLFLRLREMFHHFIQQISQTQLARCRDWYRVAQTQIIELINVGHKLFKAVHLIDN